MAHKIIAICIAAIVALVLGALKASAIENCRSQDELVRGASVVWDNLHLESTADAKAILSQIRNVWYHGETKSDCQRQIVENLAKFAEKFACDETYYKNTCNVIQIMDAFVETAKQVMEIYFNEYAKKRGDFCAETARHRLSTARVEHLELVQVDNFFKDILGLRKGASFSEFFKNLQKFDPFSLKLHAKYNKRILEFGSHCRTLFGTTYLDMYIWSLKFGGDLEMVERALYPDYASMSLLQMNRICAMINSKASQFKANAESSQ